MTSKKIAIIGTGVSGLTAAYLLHKHHDITVFEKASRLGGHTATKTVEVQNNRYAIDTGFIVYNDWTYPNFIRLLKQLGVDTQATTMGFSVSDSASGYEYAGENINTLFCQRRNFFSIKHWRMIRDILRFNKEAVRDFQAGDINATQTLGQYLSQHGYSDAFRDFYLLPMGAAIWSSSLGEMLDFPLLFFVRFCHNHGLLSVNERPTWRVIKGGSHAYIPKITQGYKERIRLGSQITQISRTLKGVELIVDGQRECFDEVVFACHSDEALALLSDASASEQEVLGAIHYRPNSVILHTDQRLLPKHKLAWSSWNYQLGDDAQKPPVLTYNMNILQCLDAPVEFCVTLNAREKIDDAAILGEYEYAHPVFTQAAIAAQERWGEVNGVNKTWFCGAYWFNGFHEDGVKSAARVAQFLEGDTLTQDPFTEHLGEAQR
ncbi:NAD(P)/FAD-dependent oxidoreductase [Marinagarivorans algicola]|uniref:NAD(P)/FAD-dependent oxidoreductase n=1 Tax=Marinagarivorans algicola TaxID=1513270 RepID=UPI00373514A3